MSHEMQKIADVSNGWIFSAFAIGLTVAMPVYALEASGPAEIALLMVTMTALAIKMFWAYHIEKWFYPFVLL